MASPKTRTGRVSRIDGLIQPRDTASLRGVWQAFARGDTWMSVGKRSRRVSRFRHKRYGGQVRLEWWGKALRFVVEDSAVSGRIAGAFLGHVQRHAQASVDRVDMQFR